MCEKHYRRWWRETNKEHNKAYEKQHYEKVLKPKRTWQQKPKQCKRCKIAFIPTGKNQKFCCLTCQNNDTTRRKLSQPKYKISHNLRSRLRKAIKKGSPVKNLGCSIDELKTHLESKFQPGMTWDNYGKWHIDHIKPLSSFDLTDPRQLKDACSYKNLQPLWAKDNLIKGASHAAKEE